MYTKSMTQTESFQIGQQVTITRGRSKGHVGTVTYVSNDRYTVRFTDVPAGTPDMQGFSYDAIKAASLKAL